MLDLHFNQINFRQRTQEEENDDDLDDDLLEAYLDEETKKCTELVEKFKKHLKTGGAEKFMAHVDKNNDGTSFN